MILTQRHDGGLASTDSVCWKCKKAYICLPAKDSDMLIFIAFEKAQNTVGKKLIHVRMNACIQFSTLILSNTFCKNSNFVWTLILHLWKHVQYQWTNNDIPSSFTVKNYFLVVKWITCFLLTPSLKVELDSLEVELVMV